RKEAIRRDAAVEVVHRDIEPRLGEAAVDPAHELLDGSTQLPILANLAPARHGDLHERDLAAQVGSQLEQKLDRAEALGDALRVVEPVDAEQQPAVGELLAEPRERPVDAGLARPLREIPCVDRDWVGSRPDLSPVGELNRGAVDLDAVDELPATPHAV